MAHHCLHNQRGDHAAAGKFDAIRNLFTSPALLNLPIRSIVASQIYTAEKRYYYQPIYYSPWASCCGKTRVPPSPPSNRKHTPKAALIITQRHHIQLLAARSIKTDRRSRVRRTRLHGSIDFQR